MRRAELIRLFEFEPDLLAVLPPAEADSAVARTVVECVTLYPGELEPPVVPADDVDLGFLVLEGLLINRLEFAGRRAVELIGPGGPGPALARRRRRASSLPGRPSWKVLRADATGEARPRLRARRRRWPRLHAALLDRLDARMTGPRAAARAGPDAAARAAPAVPVLASRRPLGPRRRAAASSSACGSRRRRWPTSSRRGARRSATRSPGCGSRARSCARRPGAGSYAARRRASGPSCPSHCRAPDNPCRRGVRRLSRARPSRAPADRRRSRCGRHP